MPFVMSCVTNHDDDIPTQNPRYTEHSPLGITEIAVLWISVFVGYYLIICHNLLIIPNLPTLKENLQCNYSSDYILCDWILNVCPINGVDNPAALELPSTCPTESPKTCMCKKTARRYTHSCSVCFDHETLLSFTADACYICTLVFY